MSERFNADGLALSSQYALTMNTLVLPALRALEKQTTLKGAGGYPLYCVRYDAETPRGTVLILHGFTENAFKYAELIYSLLQNGFSVAAFDQAGHGRSRDLQAGEDASLTDIDRFQDYVDDMETVVEQILSAMPRPWLLFSHSMGGAVSALYLEKHPEVFQRAAFCAPMIAPALGGLPVFAAKHLCYGAKAMGRGGKRIFVSKPYSGFEDFDTSAATGRARFDWYEQVKNEHPEFTNNGPTYRWTLESLGVTQRILQKGEVEKIQCPLRLYTAQLDTSVEPGPQGQFIARVRQGDRVFVENARHEIYRSEDEVLFPWWRDVLSFLKEE